MTSDHHGKDTNVKRLTEMAAINTKCSENVCYKFTEGLLKIDNFFY